MCKHLNSKNNEVFARDETLGDMGLSHPPHWSYAPGIFSFEFNGFTKGRGNFKGFLLVRK